MRIRLKLLCLTLLAALLVAWISYRQAYGAALAAVGPQVRKSSSANGRPSRERAARVDKLEQLRGLLSRPFNPRNSTEAWDIISSMSVAQIQQVLEDISKNKASDSARDIISSLYFRWGQIDPMAAVAAAALQQKEVGTENYSQALYFAYNGWFKRDPEAAFQWAKNSSVLEEGQYVSGMGRYIASLPPAEAAEKMKSCGPAVTKSAISFQGQKMTSSPEDRKAFLDRVAGSGMNAADTQTVLKGFARSWGLDDPVGALAGLDGIPLDNGEKSQARQTILLAWTDRNPAEAIAWVAKENTPQAMGKIYEKWERDDPTAALTSWDQLSSNMPGLREEVMKSQLKSYYMENWGFPGRNESSERYLFSNLKDHYDHWSAAAPADAEKWLGSLEPSLQQKLRTSR